MRLRVRIFLLVGGLFFIAFIISQGLEEYLTSDNLRFEAGEIHEQIIHHEEIRRQNINRFARSLIDHRSNEINVLFSKIQEYNWQRRRFAPTQENYKKETWLASAALIFQNKWIDYLQNTIDGKIVSMIVLDERNPSYAAQIMHDEHFSFIMTKDDANDPEWDGPYIGIPYGLDLVDLNPSTLDEKKVNQNGFQPSFFVIYEPKALMTIDLDAIENKLKTYAFNVYPSELHVDEIATFKPILKQIINDMHQAKHYFTHHPDVYKAITGSSRHEWIEEKLKQEPDRCQRMSEEMQSLSNASWLSIRFDKLSMIWQLTSLLATHIFGTEPFAKEFPIGMVQVLPKHTCGQAILNTRVFFDRLDIASQKRHELPGLYGTSENDLKVIYQDANERLFFGNTMHMSQLNLDNQMSHGTMSIAVDARSIVRDIALATSAETFFVSQDRVLKGFNKKGIELYGKDLDLPLHSMHNHPSGFIQYQGNDYFFMKISPYQGVHFDFFLLVPKHEEFGLSMAVHANAQKLIEKISIQMQIIALVALIIVLFALNHIASHVTQPISHLAKACRSLHRGHLNEVHLPELKKRAKDEVYTLYHSFSEMVNGLKEKEKVQGVLNKVVSPEIAKEILKGDVHLGGEERIVTVLFADIRNFTKISENMPPHELIDMLNTCMTKISHVIDAHGGVIDKYVGDEVMALFGAPIEDEMSGYKAITCAFEIMHVLKEWNRKREEKQLATIEMGIGIHTGLVVAGNMGADNRLNYTVLGANVNLAARLCSIAKPGEILVSHLTLDGKQIKESFDVQSLDKVELKGFSDPIDVYQVVKAHNPPQGNRSKEPK